jgi:SAM-dependent methyltransferase
VAVSASADAASWDAEYAGGRYRDEPPVAFTRDIIGTATARGLTKGLYIGCGNGRNLVPMLAAGLDLTGLDISARAIGQLRRRRPELRSKLIVGDLAVLPRAARYQLVIGIQVFQHGTRTRAHRHLASAAARVRPGGLLCVRVNASTTDVEHQHVRFDNVDDGSFTVRYLAGPKAGLDIHFFTAGELRSLVGDRFEEILSPRLDSAPRVPPGQGGRPGEWAQFPRGLLRCVGCAWGHSELRSGPVGCGSRSQTQSNRCAWSGERAAAHRRRVRFW